MACMFQRTVLLSYLSLGVLFFITGEVAGQIVPTGLDGTTPDIQDIFNQRCHDFQSEHPQTSLKNCSVLWDLFLNSFKDEDKCSVFQSDYAAFLQEATKDTTITDKAMFWSRVSPFVYQFAANQSGKYTTILDILPGYILNDTTWCWSNANDSLDYDSCPPYRSDNCSAAVYAFWKAASGNLAELANGKVFAMLNGSTSGAYSNTSIFYTVEVPTMASPRITEMQVILVQNLNGPVTENCNSGTLVNLKETLRNKNIAYSCIENPPEVVAFLCRLHPELHPECKINVKPKDSAPSENLSVNRASLITGFLSAIAMRYMPLYFPMTIRMSAGE